MNKRLQFKNNPHNELALLNALRIKTSKISWKKKKIWYTDMFWDILENDTENAEKEIQLSSI